MICLLCGTRTRNDTAVGVEVAATAVDIGEQPSGVSALLDEIRGRLRPNKKKCACALHSKLKKVKF